MNVIIIVAYMVGSAPFCAVDSVGNWNCFYYDVYSCREVARNLGGICQANPNRE